MSKKIVKILVLSFAVCLLFCGCGEQSVKKTVTGIDPVFEEPLGYYNEHPSVIDEGNERYVYYTKNEKINDASTESIVVRKGVLEDGKWKYGEPSVALSPSKDGWDGKKVFQADVVKGVFNYKGEAYGYLMAYAGVKSEISRKGAQINLAVSKTPTGPFVKISDNPFITWDAKDYSHYGEVTTDGVSEPSLINFNGQSQIILFYSLNSPNTSVSCKYVLLDLSEGLDSLTQRKGERGNLLSRKGITDMSSDNACIGADFALNEEKTYIYAVRDYLPIPTLSPSVAEAVQVIKAPVNILTETESESSPKWQIVDDKISSLDTAVWEKEGMFGYDRIYSGSFIGNGFGYVKEDSVYITFTSCATASSTADYKFTAMIHEYKVI